MTSGCPLFRWKSPFFEFNILDFKDRDVEELKKFAKAAFDVDSILVGANDLKYIRAIKQVLASWMTNPSEDFVRLVAGDLISGKRFTPAIKDQFTAITKRAFEQLLGERINQRLKGAMTPDPVSAPEPATEVEAVTSAEPVIVTAEEELEGFYAVRAMLRGVVASKRVVIRDAQSYCAVLLDDNNRKPICRLRFNNPQKLRLGIFNDKKEEEIISIESVDEIFNYEDRLKATVAAYLGSKDAEASS